MNAGKKYRYPGIASFETTDSDIFFGREDDRQNLADRVEIEKSTLVYSRSGLGKSSLLKAALIPELQKRGYLPYYIRLGLAAEDSIPPVQNVLRRTVLAAQQKLPRTYLEKFLNRSSSLWYAFKSMQAVEPSGKTIVLIFDQFEEIGSYPAKAIREFGQQIAELLYTPIPNDYVDALKHEDLLTEALTDEELEMLYKPLRVKVVFSIRSDQLSVINSLSDYLPNILKTYYELKPLSQKQALNAIVMPGRKAGEFITPSFEYQREAQEKIVQSLSSQKTDDIDTAQLQILLQYVEKDIVEKTADTDITAADLGDLSKVYENYYLNSLGKLSASQQDAQVLIEDKLIGDGRRISYDKALCLQLINQTTLDELIETRLLRREPNTMGGYSYEVSHDSLVAPILKTRDGRKQKEEKESLRLQVEAQRLKQRKQRKLLMIMTIAFLVSVGAGVFAVVAKQDAQLKEENLARILSYIDFYDDKFAVAKAPKEKGRDSIRYIFVSKAGGPVPRLGGWYRASPFSDLGLSLVATVADSNITVQYMLDTTGNIYIHVSSIEDLQYYSDFNNLALDLNTSKLEVLPVDEITDPSRFSVLSISSNKIERLPDSFRPWSHLKYLDVSNNMLDVLPDDITELKELMVMNLSDNFFTEDYLDALRKRMPQCRIISTFQNSLGEDFGE